MPKKQSKTPLLNESLDGAGYLNNSVAVATDETAPAKPVSKAEAQQAADIEALPKEIYGTSHHEDGEHEFHKHNSLKDAGQRFSGTKQPFVVGVYRLVKVVKIVGDKRRGASEVIVDFSN